MLNNNRIDRNCKNEHCEIVISKEDNPKKIFCSLSCKNRYHCDFNSFDNKVLKEHMQQLKRSRYKILEYLSNEIYRIDKVILPHIGFDPKVYMGTKIIKGAADFENKFKAYIIDEFCFWFKDGYCYFDFLENIDK